jgi:hypothetical protein
MRRRRRRRRKRRRKRREQEQVRRKRRSSRMATGSCKRMWDESRASEAVEIAVRWKTQGARRREAERAAVEIMQVLICTLQ